MKKIAFFINGTIRRKDSIIQEIKSLFTHNKFELKICISEKSRHIESLVFDAIKDQYNYLIFVGGDGTINEGLNGLMQSCQTENNFLIQDFDMTLLEQVKVGILPAGSGNDFAKTVNCIDDIAALKKKIEADSFEKVDIGYATFYNEHKERTNRFYMNITDVGMGGVIAKKIVHKNNALSADLFYLKAIFTTLISYKNTLVNFSTETENWQSNIMSLIFANGQFFGSGLGVAPNANIQDGIFNIIKLGDITVWDYIYHLKDIKNSKFIQHPEVSYSKAKKLKVSPADNKDLMIDMDGEFVGYAPMEIECVHKAINLIF